MNKKQNSNFEQVKTFDLLALQKAFEEGRLYIQPKAKPEAELREEGIKAILSYVSRIDDCSSSIYRSHIREIWERILRDQMLNHLFFMEKGKRRNMPNWYRVTSVVGNLRESNVYRKDDFNFMQLHLQLEGVKRKNGRYTGSTLYYLTNKELTALRHILKDFAES